ncbi:ABC-three component system protein [Methanoculleus sp.]|uniref:ABC-three component system protein n=1 Tax=Methanoculleus sp. TaxID=90427 RepID=UPI001BD251E7|nr:ABC-three component system protein [Methanoculleus sp.]
MIHSVSANHSSFHTVTFTTGLNVVLAERSEVSTEKDTRNGLGKSTLIEIIDFCLGSGVNKGEGLLIEPLEQWAFTLEITLGGNRVKVTRAVADHKRIVINGPTNGWIEQPDCDNKSGELIFKVERWRQLLGWALFSLPRSADQLPYKPSFRSLISYMVRRGPDAYISPFQHNIKQQNWDIQLHIAYLLGMNWEFPARLRSLKDREDGVKAIEKAIKTGAMDGAIGTVGELETQRIQLEQQTASAKEALDTFKVHPQYDSVQQNADRLTKEIHDLINHNVTDKRRLGRYQESIKEEKPPARMSLERLYEEFGLIFPDAVKRTLNEARTFHHQIISNRHDFLEVEIVRFQKDIDEREARIKELTNQRAELMEVLQTHGALQEMTKLQGQYVVLKGSLDHVQTRLREVKNLNITKREIRAKKVELVQTAEQDHEQRREVWSEAVRLFNEHSQALYKTAGRLVIDVNEKGYTYNVEIERSGSEGIDKMKIFCFDLTVLQLQMQAHHGIDFIIHDTLMYDSVDTRQRALAFQCAHEVTNSLGGQYICTINSDMVPTEDFSDDFDFQQHVRLTLSDATPSGSLLGIRFERPSK